MSQQIYDVIMALRATNSKLEKQAILNAQRDNDLLKNFLKTVYEPRINFYISELKNEGMFFGEGELTIDVINSIVDTLHGRKLTGNAARAWLSGQSASLNTEAQHLLGLMIDRSVQAGISTTTINKTWSNLLTEYPYMRCSLPASADPASWPWANGIYSQIKADGMFSNVIIREKKLSFVTRSGNPFPLEYFKNIEAELVASGFNNEVLHGELLMRRVSTGKILPREEGNGIFNSMLKDGVLEDDYQPEFHVWDSVPIENFDSREDYDVAYKSRFDRIIQNISEMSGNFVKLIEYKIVYSWEEAVAHARECIANGLEGTVAKHRNAPWIDGTSKFQIKLKQLFEVDLKIVGFRDAAKTSKNASMFGSIICESSDGLLSVSSTGIKDKMRKEINDIKDKLISQGAIITIKANGIMQPNPESSMIASLFLPRVVEIRMDKVTANSYEEIVAIQNSCLELS